MVILLKAAGKPDREGLSNPFKLPRGEPLRREIIAVFREQRSAILRFLKTGKKDVLDAGLRDRLRIHAGRADGAGRDRLAAKDQGPPVPVAAPDWDDFRLGALAISERMTPLLTLTWEAAATAFAPRVGLDPDSWSVVNPHTERMIEEAALAFCDATNETTTLALDEALAQVRAALDAGIVQAGETLPALTRRINAIFDAAESWRARRIAWTETSRAVHAAQEQAAIASGVVTGWRWLLSGDACRLCIAIAARTPAVRLGQPFAVIGTDPHYSTIKFPPAHPHCSCSLVEVIDTDPQPAWGETLHDPDPATEDEHRRVAEETQARDDATLGKRMRPAAIKRPRPLARKKKPLTEPGDPDQRGFQATGTIDFPASEPRWSDQRPSGFFHASPGRFYA